MPRIKKELKEIEDDTKKVLKEKSVSKSRVTKKSDEKAKTTKKTSAKTKSEKSTAKKPEKKTKVTKTTKNSKDKLKKAESSKKSTTTKTKKTSEKKLAKKVTQEYLQEYYDLPYRYNETVVKILAQTPKRLFVYWDVSDKDKETFINAFGEDFFDKTYPVLLVHNEELNYTFEVPINDFANSWYLDIKDSKTKYVVKLGRKFRNIEDIKPSEEVLQKECINIQNDYINITNSNKLEVPNDHILFENIQNQVTYRNVKNGNEYKKDISDIIEKLNKTYKDIDIEKMYREFYGDEISEDILLNPSSGALSSSGFKIN